MLAAATSSPVELPAAASAARMSATERNEPDMDPTLSGCPRSSARPRHCPTASRPIAAFQSISRFIGGGRDGP